MFATPNFRAMGAALATLAAMSGTLAQTPPVGADMQFDVLGPIQEATLDNCSNALCGGTIKVNGHRIVIPANTIVILPGMALTWKELFTLAPATYLAAGSSGLALADVPAPLAAYEAHLIGNQVGDTYIAGLVNIAQHSLNAGSGLINYIDYATGELRVGGKLVRDGNGVPRNALDAAQPGTRIRLNDPVGRYGRKMAGDPRFAVDADSPTVRSVTGYPMCVPRVAPTAQASDPACPEGNRPKNPDGLHNANFTMPDPAAVQPGHVPDPRIMAPFEVGDSVTYSGTLVSDAGPQGPYASGSTYIAAHTFVANVAIYTAPFTDPAYVAIDVALLGNGGVTEPGALEATMRTRFEGFTTDPSRNIRLYGVDVAPDGSTSERDWGVVSVDPGAPTGAQKGRWRFRPPCTGLVASVNFCFGPLDENTFLPATREVRAVVEGAWTPSSSVPQPSGIVAGQYHAPIGEYLFQEGLPGGAPPAIAFATMPFLARGGYSSATGVVATGPLNPWPGSGGVPSTCTAPTADAGASVTVLSGATGSLKGTASGSGSLTVLWTPPKGFTLSPSATVLTPSFTAPAVTATNTYLFTLAVTGCGGQTATSAVAVTVTPAQQNVPFINPIAPVSVASGATATLTAVPATSPNKLTYSWTQTGGPTQSFQTSGAGASLQVSHVVPIGQTTADVLSYTVVATDSVTGAKSRPVTGTASFTPAADVERITVAEYRVAKQRLDITAVSSVANAKVVLTLQPYKTTNGKVFDPASVGNTLTNNGGGNYTITIVGVPQPGPGEGLVVKSNLGGESPPTPLTRIR
ncbi:hypothetical protein [Cupriavidus basilensis]|uniref:Ig-like domain-containing protein n=1 Tax=Cupriavidus basilensis TaxID=68895 RepID=A0A643FQ69_9BURK|nr:hypothetical protein [Cupriavidus basilensis]QOT79435.1 hypothetical protein F7R26_032455 [Cupriavidus basilensis]